MNVLAATTMGLVITSGVFMNNGDIPSSYTCEGKNISPPISWSGIPEGTKSMVLIMDDPDAPNRTYVHWVLYNIPVKINGFKEGESQQLPSGILQGLNSANHIGYMGPCPPTGRHRYFFKLYALNVVLEDLKQPTKAALEKAIEGHVLEKAELVGTYVKTNS